MSEDFDFAIFKARALAALQASKPLTGKDGVLAPLLENLLNSALEGEMGAHMNADERDAGNRRNGYGSKQVQSSVGELTVRPRETAMRPSILNSSKNVNASLPTASLSGLLVYMPRHE